MRQNAVGEVMSELCVYGGLLATRAEVYADLVNKNDGGLSWLTIDRLVWMPPKATKEQADALRAAGMTLAEHSD